MAIYKEFCKVMLNQSVSRLGKNQPIIIGGKISQILIITNKAIQTAS